jgi:hypothetical protein
MPARRRWLRKWYSVGKYEETMLDIPELSFIAEYDRDVPLAKGSWKLSKTSLDE